MRILVLATLAGLLLITQTGCVKWYCCGYPSQAFKCTKNGDSTLVVISAPVFNIQNTVKDTLSVYRANGFTCTLKYIDSTGGKCTRGASGKKAAESAGQICGTGTETRCFNDGGDFNCE